MDSWPPADKDIDAAFRRANAQIDEKYYRSHLGKDALDEPWERYLRLRVMDTEPAPHVQTLHSAQFDRGVTIYDRAWLTGSGIRLD